MLSNFHSFESTKRVIRPICALEFVSNVRHLVLSLGLALKIFRMAGSKGLVLHSVTDYLIFSTFVSPIRNSVILETRQLSTLAEMSLFILIDFQLP